MRALIILDRVLGTILLWGATLVLPVSLLLFLQWPLRDLVHHYSREANDFAQLLFALYVSLAVTCAHATTRTLPPMLLPAATRCVRVRG